MKVLLADEWVDGYLDEALASGQARIQVNTWTRHQAVEGLYWVRAASALNVATYVKKVGVKEVARKVKSRAAERGRNHRWLGSGTGIVVEAGSGSKHTVGSTVRFIAPAHPQAMERVVLDDRLIAKISPCDAPPSGKISLTSGSDLASVEGLIGWHPHSGEDLPLSLVARAFESIVAAEAQSATLARVPASQVHETSERTRTDDESAPKPTASLFGYGNYAKTVVLPSVQTHLDISVIHEIDPLQIGRPSPETGWDTSPIFRNDERPDVALIAGFHHTHADLSLEALRRGARVLTEKPTATTRDQVDAIDSFLTSTPSAVLHVGFHKRHSPFNDDAKQDLAWSSGEPIDYHCVVFEEKVPPLQWYGWPNSRTRLTSNGCHWIDHFLHLNDYPEIETKHVISGRRGTINVFLEAQNGAVFTMVLTDEGTARKGVRDHVQCRLADRTVTINDNMNYVSENGSRVLRRKRAKGLDAHRIMYDRLVSDMLDGRPGETPNTALAAARICLDLEDLL